MSLEPVTANNDTNVTGAHDELVQANIRVLFQLRETLDALSNDQYANQPSADISSIGMHTRHIIEFYQEFFKALDATDNQDLCYDRRQRNMTLETSRDESMKYIANIQNSFLDKNFADRELSMCCIINPDKPLCNMQSTVHRELYHVLDHCVHHMALIKMVGQQVGVRFDPDFGLANATKQYRKNA